MPQPILYVAITNHGFGHATRTASVIAELQHRYPEILIILATSAPRWLLESYIPGDFIHRHAAIDIGVIQSDSLTMDKPATLEKLQQIRAKAKALIAAEVNFIKQNRVSLVLADIPPLAVAIAHTANIPCWMMSNFGWDFIYRPWGGEFIDQADWIAEQFSQCDRLFRLPFHEPMSAFPTITDVGLTGGNPRFAMADLRSEFAINTPIDRTILLTFGGLGIEQIPYHNLDRFPDWCFITFDRQAPDSSNIIKIAKSQHRPVDFMPLCSRVVSKPGYSTFAEACRTETPLITITREAFAESPVLIAAMQNCHPHLILDSIDFFQGDWSFLEKPMQPPRTEQRLAKDGNEAIAQAIANYLPS